MDRFGGGGDRVTSLEGRGGGAFAGEGGGCLAVLALVALEDLAHGVAISVRVADRVSPLEIFSCAARSGLSCGPSLEESRRRKKELGTKDTARTREQGEFCANRLRNSKAHFRLVGALFPFFSPHGFTAIQGFDGLIQELLDRIGI